jgi:GNAT superfamily N-acetyltransferase
MLSQAESVIRIQEDAGIGHTRTRHALSSVQAGPRPALTRARAGTRRAPKQTRTRAGREPARAQIGIPQASGGDCEASRAQVGIRQASSGDCEAIKDFLAGLSPRTRYLRFFTGAPTANTAALLRLAGDGENIDAVVATEAGTIIGHAMGADTTGPAGARVTEIGVAVTDTRQGQGVGTALTRELALRARARGATALAMDVLAENRQVMTMIADHWPTAHYDRSGPYVTIYAHLTRPGETPTTPPSAEGAAR